MLSLPLPDSRLRMRWVLAAVAIACAGCSGGQMPDGAQPNGPAPGAAASLTVPRRLSRVEYDNTVRDLVGDTSRPGFAMLPEDSHDPFDNDYNNQQVSAALVEAVETLAEGIATRLVAD